MPWIISAAADRVELDTARQASITFTVTNNGSVDDRAVLDVVPGGNADRSWFAFGERQRFIPHGASLPFQVNVTVPPQAPPGAGWVQGRVYSADAAPEESSVLSDRVVFEVKPAGVAKTKPNMLLWLIPVVVLVVVTLGVVIGWLVLGGDSGPAKATDTTTTAPPPSGPDVTNVQLINARSAVVGPGQSADAVATCPAGTVVIGGGHVLRSPVGMVIDVSRPASVGQGWQVHGFNPNTNNFDFDIEALCATVRDHQLVSNSVVVQPGQQADATASCPAGKASTGGGGSAPGLVINASQPISSGQGWQVRAVNTTGSAQAVTAHAVCATAPSAEIATVSARVQPGTRVEGGAPCPAGKLGTGGGFSFGPATDLSLFVSAPDNTGWDVRADNRGAVARDVTAFAVCATSG